VSPGESVGAVAELWRFPVKSMLGERLDAIDVTTAGIVGDRAYGIVDAGTGKVASAKHPRMWPDLLGCRASFLEPPTTGEAAPPARIELADGTVVLTDAPDVHSVLSRFFGREVQLTKAAPENYVVDKFEPEQGVFNPRGDRNLVIDQPLGATMFQRLGIDSPVPDSSLVDLFPVSVLTTSSLRHFADREPAANWDPRRFRMNVIIETAGPGPVENGWLGDLLAIGDQAALNVALPVPRCVMTTLALEELRRDPQVLRALARQNRLDILGLGLFPCLGIYAVPGGAGTMRVGDQVRRTESDFSVIAAGA
jgi:uncharacterized protein YcbX